MKNSSDQSTGFGTRGYEKMEEDFRLNTTGLDDDLAVDIQDAIAREITLSQVSDNIVVTVEGEIVTLEGQVHREQERMAAGNIATAWAGDDNVNNYLSVIHEGNLKNEGDI